MSRVFGNIPEKEVIRENWKQYSPFLRMAHEARTTAWGLRDSDRRILGVLVALEEHEALLAHSVERVDALETSLTALQEENRGLRMTIGRMKKRKDVKLPAGIEEMARAMNEQNNAVDEE